MNSESEFLKAWASIQPTVEPEVEYRFHYDDQGTITMCTQANHPDNTQYLVVDRETYQSYFKYYVKDGKLKIIDTAPGTRVQLIRSTQGYAVVKNHAGILLETEDYQDVEYYEAN